MLPTGFLYFTSNHLTGRTNVGQTQKIMKTRSRMKRKRHEEKLRVSSSTQTQKAIREKRALDTLVAQESRDITGCSFETSTTKYSTATATYGVGSPLHGRKDENEPTPANSDNNKSNTANIKNAKPLKPTSGACLNPTPSKRDRLSEFDQESLREENTDKRENGKESNQDREEASPPEIAKSEVDTTTPKAKTSDPRTTPEPKSPLKCLADTGTAPVPADASQHRQRDNSESTTHVETGCHENGKGTGDDRHHNIHGNATSSSSTSSKRNSRPRRVSLAYLQSTRGHRRALAKARTESRKQTIDKEGERERVEELDGMDEKEKKVVIRVMEQKRRAREVARRREVKRVRNRGSVEKSRVKELVSETEVETEGDSLKWENEKIAAFLEWMREEDVMTKVENEVTSVVKRRKRSKD